MTIEIGGPSGEGGGDIGGGYGGGGGGFVPPPPAFLTKTFQIVNDPKIDHIISWGEFGDSFIIWDHIKFSAEILPNYFRHNNFSSFVYQLNNYGFRKIGVDHQWEYTNPHFKREKQHLLSNMKRRSVQNPTPQRRRKSSCSLSPERLRDAIDESKKEVKKLKMQQLDLKSHIAAVEQATHNFEAISKKLVVQWAKACAFILKRERESRCDEDEDAAKREKVVFVSAEIPLEDNEKNDEDHGEMVKENAETLCDDDHAAKSKAAEINGNCSNDLEYWMKKLLEDDEACEVGSEAANQHAEIAKDFQELITKQADADCSLAMKIDLQELFTEQADADYSLEMKTDLQELLIKKADQTTLRK